jgi:acyl-CoA synthetase (AMP-forming)/AMP-acid ligase II
MPTANLSRLLERNKHRFGDREAVVDGEVRLTYLQLDAAVSEMSQGLLELGYGRGDIIAILADNSYRYLIEILAINRIGAAFIPLNWRLHSRELTYILNHSGAGGLVVDERFHQQARDTLASSPKIRHVITHADQGDAGWHLYEEVMASCAGAQVPDAEMGLDDLARILYTSGTTSHPKGVITTHGNVIWNQLGQILEMEMVPTDRVMLSAPLFHVSGLDVPGLTALYIGATLVVVHSYAGPEIVKLVDKEKVVGGVLAAQIIHDIMRMEDRDHYDLSSLKWIIFGGLPAPVYRRFQRTLPHVRLSEAYGMTELTNGAAYLEANPPDDKIGSVGRPFANIDLQIVDDEGRPVPPGEPGELIARGPKVSPGYWNDPEETAAAFRDGWFYSGDICRIDADGYMWFVDRKKDMIKSGGENVASAEIERVLAKHPAVAETAVVGVPDPRWDEVPKAFVVTLPEMTVTEEEIAAHCRANLAKFKVPKHIEIVDALVRNDSGKVMKRWLRDAERDKFRAGNRP